MDRPLDRRFREMADINLEVWDATGNKRQVVELPDDAPVNRILAVLLEKMSFPQYAHRVMRPSGGGPRLYKPSRR